MLLLAPLGNVFCLNAFIILLIQLCTSFGKLNGIELPLELLRGDANDGKSMNFVRRMTFPSDNGVELPPNIEDNGFVGKPPIEDSDDFGYDVPIKSEMPKWLQLQLQPETQQHASKFHQTVIKPKHIQTGKHHHDNQQMYTFSTTAASATAGSSSPLKRCAIEISNKIPGICQTMGSIGYACVSGDYIDVFNAECL